MPRRLNSKDASFHNDCAALLSEKRESAVEVGETVGKILADVRKRGDLAVIDYTQQFDRLALKPEQRAISAEEIQRWIDRFREAVDAGAAR